MNNSNVDQWVFRVAGVFILLSVALAWAVSPWWLGLAVFVGFNMLQASFSGFCPLAIILSKLGVPTGCAFSPNKS